MRAGANPAGGTMFIYLTEEEAIGFAKAHMDVYNKITLTYQKSTGWWRVELEDIDTYDPPLASSN